MTETKKKTCYQCQHRRTIPGDCHTQCAFDWSKDKSNVPSGDTHAIRSGWWFFPWNFDPVWMKEQCPQFLDKES